MCNFQGMKSGLENKICHKKLDILGHGVKLYWMDTTILTDAAVFDMAYQMLPRWRRDKADYYRNKTDKRLSVGAGLLLQHGLSESRVSGRDAAVVFGQYGKPCLPKHPEIHFNLSHAGSLAAAAFADTDIGCDVEQVRQADMALAERFFCAGENVYLAQMEEGEARNMAFYRLWTLKESFVKVTGLGLGKLSLDAFEVELLPDGAVKIHQQVDGAEYGFWERYDEGMCLAICVRTDKNR